MFHASTTFFPFKHLTITGPMLINQKARTYVGAGKRGIGTSRCRQKHTEKTFSGASVFLLLHLCQQRIPLPHTVRNNKPFQEASKEEVRRIYYVGLVFNLHSPLIYLQQKTPGHIFPLVL